MKGPDFSFAQTPNPSAVKRLPVGVMGVSVGTGPGATIIVAIVSAVVLRLLVAAIRRRV